MIFGQFHFQTKWQRHKTLRAEWPTMAKTTTATTKIGQYHILIHVISLENGLFSTKHSDSKKYTGCTRFLCQHSQHQCWNFAAIWQFFLSAPHPWVHLTQAPLRCFPRCKTSSTPCMCLLWKAVRATDAVSLSWRATLPVNAARYAVALFAASRQADQRERVWSHWGRSLFTRHTRKIQLTLKHGASAVELFTWSFKFKDPRAVTGTAERRSRYLCFMGLPGLGWRAVMVSSAALTYIILRGNRKWKRSV